MKKLLVALAFLISAFSLSAVDLSLSALFNYDLVQQNGALMLNQKKISDIAYIGFLIDIPFSETNGLLLADSVKFQDVPQSESTSAYTKNIHWDGNFLAAWHAMTYQARFDPYLMYGVGCSGAVFFDQRALDPHTKTQIVIFPEVGIGMNLEVVKGVLIGANLRTQILSFNPSPLKTYEQFPVALTINAGLRL